MNQFIYFAFFFSIKNKREPLICIAALPLGFSDHIHPFYLPAPLNHNNGGISTFRYSNCISIIMLEQRSEEPATSESPSTTHSPTLIANLQFHQRRFTRRRRRQRRHRCRRETSLLRRQVRLRSRSHGRNSGPCFATQALFRSFQYRNRGTLP